MPTQRSDERAARLVTDQPQSGTFAYEQGRLTRSEELYRLAVRATNDMIWDLDFGTNQLEWNEALFTNLGYAPGEVGPTLQWWIDQLHPDDRDEVADHFRQVVESGEEQFTAEYRFRKSDGTYAWIYDRGYIVRDASGRPVRGVGAMQDQTDRKLSEEALGRSESLNRSIIEANPDCVSVLDLDGRVMFSNEAAVRAYGLKSDAPLVGQRWGHRLDAKAQKEIDGALAAAANGELARLTLQLPNERGSSTWYESILSPVRDADGTLVRYLVMSRDITGHKSAERQIQWTANHDPLTKLPNRLLFQQRLDDLIARATCGKAGFSLLLIDVDEFKQVNDTLGHDAGDMLLCTVGERLRTVVRKDDFVARLGGDEFAVLLKRAVSEVEVRTVSEKIIRTLKEPWIHSGRVLDCQASIGASIYGCHGSKGSELLKNADVALYTAKDRGRCRTTVFEPRMRINVQKRSQMVEVARFALREQLIVPFYQPQVDLQTGKIAGFEALLRVRHPTRGLLAPSHVSAALEDVDVAADIGDRMAQLVLADVGRWLQDELEIGHVAINAAAADFRRGHFAERLLEQMKRHHVPSTMIQLEVTETVFIGRGAEYVECALKTLSRSGVRIALDDFGTGYASLAHLQQFPIDVIKIDRSFVRKMTGSSSDAAIVRAVLTLGKSLGLDVIAEGIEKPEEEAQLRAEGCRFVQGYFYGRPMPAARVPVRMQRYRSAA